MGRSIDSKREGLVVVVTGASGGVGRAIARELGRRKAKLALVARGSEGLDAAAKEVRELGGTALCIPTDVARAEEVERAAEVAERELGPIDVWINNAMVTAMAPIAELGVEELDRVTRVTYLGACYGTMSALRRMKPRDRGHIIQVGSALAYRAIPLQAAYCGAKHALRGFTDSLRSELIHDRSNVLLSMVQLPGLNTPQFEWSRVRLPNQPQPVPPIFSPEIAARAIVDVIGKSRRELAVGSSTLQTIIGSKFVNGWLDRYLAKKAYSGQQTDVPVPPDRPDNLFEPARGDFGVHGPFEAREKQKSPMTWAALHRTELAAGFAALVAGGAALLRFRG